MNIQRMFLAASAAALVLSGPATAGPRKTAKDTSPPSVSILDPAAGATVHGTVQVNVAAADNVGLKQVILTLDGYFVDAKAFAPWTLIYPSATNLQPGAHTLQAQAQDTSGNWTKSAPVTVNVVPPDPGDDIVCPRGTAIVTPYNWGVVSGTVPVEVQSSDDVGVVCIAVYVDGNPPVNCAGPSATIPWNTAGLAPGSYHSVQAIAYDAAGNYEVSPMITVKISR